MADREDGLAGLVEVTNHVLDALVGADIFWAAPTGTIDRVIFLDAHFRECLVDVGVLAQLLGVGLVAFEIVQRRLDPVAGVLVWAHDVHGMANCLHALLIDKDFVFLGEFAGEHQDLLADDAATSVERRQPMTSEKVKGRQTWTYSAP